MLAWNKIGKELCSEVARTKTGHNITRIQIREQTLKNGSCVIAGFSLTHRKEVRTSVKYMVIYRHKDKYSISEMCRFFEVSRSGYYDYVKRMDAPGWDLPLAEKIRECQEHSHSTYGYRRVHIWLESQGIYKNPKTVLRVMQKYNLLSEVRRKKYHNYTNGLYKYENHLVRNFTAERLNEKWVTDISYIKTGQGYCIFLLFAISMTTVLLPTRPAPNRMLTLFSLRSEQPRERKRSLQICSSIVTKAFNTLSKHILS